MRTPPGVVGVAVAALGAAAYAGAACASTRGAAASAAVARLAGCYNLTLGRWSRGGLVFGAGAPVGLPAHIRLVGEPDEAVGRGRYPVRPALAAAGSRSDFPGSWAVDGGRNAVAIWSLREGKYQLLLAPAAGDTLRGVVGYTPVGLAGEYPRSASAVGVRERCPADLR